MSMGIIDFNELEAMDGLQWTWNTWPSSQIEAVRIVIPLGILCMPLMVVQGEENQPQPLPIPLLPYDPLLFSAFHTILNPYARVNYQANLWTCPLCFHCNYFPPSYSSIEKQNLPAELFHTYNIVEYRLQERRPQFHLHISLIFRSVGWSLACPKGATDIGRRGAWVLVCGGHFPACEGSPSSQE